MEKKVEDKKQRISDIILNHQEPTTSENSPPATARPPERSPSDSSLSSCRLYLSDGEGPEHGFHPSPSPPTHSDGEGPEHGFHPSPSPPTHHPSVELVTAANQSVPNEPVSVKKTLPAATGDGFFSGAVEGVGGGGGVSTTGTRPMSPPCSTIGRTTSEGAVKKTALGFRVFGFAFCLVSLSVMAADRNKGWALDSFDRYIEFRYCMMVNLIGFAYSGLQGLNLAYQLCSGKYVSGSHIRYIFDFAFDQMVAYLLISSSSMAAIRVDDWRSNWGKDKFPDMASASVTVSFMSFVSFASSSIISGYTLCIHNPYN